MSYEITGRVKAVYETQAFPSGFQKRTFVIEYTDGEYTNELALDLLKDKVSMADKLSVGAEAKFFFNVRSNENSKKEGQWFTNVTCWKFELGEGADPASPPAENQAGPTGDWQDDPNEDDIPF